jgi:hypothetical protein
MFFPGRNKDAGGINEEKSKIIQQKDEQGLTLKPLMSKSNETAGYALQGRTYIAEWF